jgi:acyl carrier protein
LEAGLTEEDILARVTQIVRDELDDDDIELSMNTQANEVEGWDSMAHVRIVIAVERAFKARFETVQITGLKNVGDLVRLVQQNLPA